MLKGPRTQLGTKSLRDLGIWYLTTVMVGSLGPSGSVGLS